MEYCNDASYLEKKLETRKKEIKNEAKLKAYAIQILEALKATHRSNVIHADMKLPNILMNCPTLDEKQAGETNVLKLCDFGVAQVITPGDFNGKKKALMKERCGSGNYIAPEIKRDGTIVGPEIDMWGFGIVLYEMCVAYKPTQCRRDYKYGQGPIPFRQQDWRKLSKGGSAVQDLILQCL